MPKIPPEKDIKIATMIWAATELTKLSATRMVTADFAKEFETYFRKIADVVNQVFPEGERPPER
jgi:hypothetical protein